MKKLVSVVVIAVIIAAIYAGWLFYSVIATQAVNRVTLTIDQGENLDSISQKLDDGSVIASQHAFKTYLKLRDYAPLLKAGTYTFSGPTSIRQVTNILISGAVSQKKVTIIEGWNLRDIAEELINLQVITTPDELYRLTGYPGKLDNSSYTPLYTEYEFFETLPIGLSMEGYLFPNTHIISADADAEDVLEKVFDDFQQKYTTRIEEELEHTSMTLHEVLTLASIVGKEAKTFQDKRMVAGVFMNRLEIGQALQSDPTVNYVTQKVTDNPSFDDIDVQSPYNTYRNAGLPPGPIANPGLDEILATLDPVDHDFYYFINTQEGELIFSSTFEEHKANRTLYGQ